MIRYLTDAQNRIVALEVLSLVSINEFKELDTRIAEAVTEHGDVKLLIHFDDPPLLTPTAFWIDVKVNIADFAKIKRVAVVGYSKWLWGFRRVFAAEESGAQIRQFSKSKSSNAWQWLNA